MEEQVTNTSEIRMKQASYIFAGNTNWETLLKNQVGKTYQET